MKKIIPVLAIVLCLALMLCACGENTPEEPQGIEGLNSKLAYAYSGWNIKVITVKSGVSLKNEFNVSKNGADYNIEYRLEKLSELSIDNPTADFKTVSSGEAKVQNGKVYVDDDTTGIAFENLTNIGLKFDTAYFAEADAKLTSSVFSANVTSPKEFCDIENASNMSVMASLEEKSFNYILISYTAQDGASVSVRYEFNA